ncbi:YdbL family protein [Crenobacter sp. SG2303]|uniref:YdbL family protein n=1 Tax=Crenobacter oryzisoli TaxID=3056844 RepID=A0ABT7XLD3_9NEIS|nr:YdbL family protein [Crenobacter sp. SG2303]MDN0074587.1 YdbL family protein [Crenobacter sp. SG2303]
MKTTMQLLAALLLTCSALTMALDLGSAKSQGLVGEQPDGYLGVVQPTPDAVGLAADINAKRRAAYEAIAQKNGATLDQVAALAGQKAIEKTPPGTYIKTPNGQWVKK